MSCMTLDPAIGILIVAGLSLLLTSAAVAKLRDLRSFEEIFAAYAVLPAHIDLPAARVLPIVELGLAIGLLLPAGRPYVGLAVIVLMLTYAAAIAVNLRRGRRDLACGCGGPAERRPIAPWMVWRNCMISGFAGISLLPWSPRPLSPMDGVTLGFGLVAITLVYLCVDLLLGDVARRSARLRGVR
jgi:Methylamine utilisation protein MauE